MHVLAGMLLGMALLPHIHALECWSLPPGGASGGAESLLPCTVKSVCARYLYWGEVHAGCFPYKVGGGGQDTCAVLKELDPEACCCDGEGGCNHVHHCDGVPVKEQRRTLHGGGRESEGISVPAGGAAGNSMKASMDCNPCVDPPTVPVPPVCSITSTPTVFGPVRSGVCDFGSVALGWGYVSPTQEQLGIPSCTSVGALPPFLAKSTYNLPDDTLWCAIGKGLDEMDVYVEDDGARNQYWGVCTCTPGTEAPVLPPTPQPTEFPSAAPTPIQGTNSPVVTRKPTSVSPTTQAPTPPTLPSASPVITMSPTPPTRTYSPTPPTRAPTGPTSKSPTSATPTTAHPTIKPTTLPTEYEATFPPTKAVTTKAPTEYEAVIPTIKPTTKSPATPPRQTTSPTSTTTPTTKSPTLPPGQTAKPTIFKPPTATHSPTISPTEYEAVPTQKPGTSSPTTKTPTLPPGQTAKPTTLKPTMPPTTTTTRSPTTLPTEYEAVPTQKPGTRSPSTKSPSLPQGQTAKPTIPTTTTRSPTKEYEHVPTIKPTTKSPSLPPGQTAVPTSHNTTQSPSLPPGQTHAPSQPTGVPNAIPSNHPTSSPASPTNPPTFMPTDEYESTASPTTPTSEYEGSIVPTASPTLGCKIVPGGPLFSGSCNFGTAPELGWGFFDSAGSISVLGLMSCQDIDTYTPAGAKDLGLTGKGLSWCPGPLGLDPENVYEKQTATESRQWGLCSCHTTQVPTMVPVTLAPGSTLAPGGSIINVTDNLDVYFHADRSRSISMANPTCQKQAGKSCWDIQVTAISNLLIELANQVGGWYNANTQKGLRAWLSTFTCNNGVPITNVLTVLTGSPIQMAGAIVAMSQLRPYLGTCPSQGLNMIAQSLQTTDNPLRPNKAVTIITDGRVDPEDSKRTTKAANRVVLAGGPLYGLTVGAQINFNYLTQICNAGVTSANAWADIQASSFIKTFAARLVQNSQSYAIQYGLDLKLLKKKKRVAIFGNNLDGVDAEYEAMKHEAAAVPTAPLQIPVSVPTTTSHPTTSNTMSPSVVAQAVLPNVETPTTPVANHVDTTMVGGVVVAVAFVGFIVLAVIVHRRRSNRRGAAISSTALSTFFYSPSFPTNVASSKSPDSPPDGGGGNSDLTSMASPPITRVRRRSRLGSHSSDSSLEEGRSMLPRPPPHHSTSGGASNTPHPMLSNKNEVNVKLSDGA